MAKEEPGPPASAAHHEKGHSAQQATQEVSVMTERTEQEHQVNKTNQTDIVSAQNAEQSLKLKSTKIHQNIYTKFKQNDCKLKKSILM